MKLENWKKKKNKLRKNKLERAQFNSDAIPTNSKRTKSKSATDLVRIRIAQ